MSRTQTCSALVLRSRPSGESNRDVWLLTGESGVLKVTVFGGPKSRLRAHAAPFNSGQVWLYHDPVRDSRKLSDFDVHCWRPGLREQYERTMAAGALSETILASHGGGGNWDAALPLAEAALDALETANGEQCAALLALFLWRWAGHLGLQPELDRCAGCGAPQPDAPPGDELPRRFLWYAPREGGLLCEQCAKALSFAGGEESAGLLRISSGCRRWLAMKPRLTGKPPCENTPARRGAGNCLLDAQTLHEAKALATAILTEALGRRLASWEW